MDTSSWTELKGQAIGLLGAQEDGAGGFEVRRVNCPPVEARMVIAFGEPWVELVATVSTERAVLHARHALMFNMRLAIGALAIDGERLVLRAALPVAQLPRDRIAQNFLFLAEEARRMSRSHAFTIEPTAVDMFAD